MPASRVWITRTRPGAERTAARVAAQGHVPVVAPLLHIGLLQNAMAAAPAPEDIACLALTSPNTLDAIGPHLAPYRALPAFAVGDATADAARNAGLLQVRSASGDINALARLVAAQSPDGPVFAPGAKQPAGDLQALLPDRRIIRLPVYCAHETDAPLPDNTDVVLLHSPRAARILASRLKPRHAARLRAVAISQAAAAPLANLPLACLDISSTPDEEGMMRTLGNSPGPV